MLHPKNFITKFENSNINAWTHVAFMEGAKVASWLAENKTFDRNNFITLVQT